MKKKLTSKDQLWLPFKELREQRAQQRKSWRDRNKEKANAYDRAWRAANPEKVREYERKKREKRKALKKELQLLQGIQEPRAPQKPKKVANPEKPSLKPSTKVKKETLKRGRPRKTEPTKKISALPPQQTWFSGLSS